MVVLFDILPLAEDGVDVLYQNNGLLGGSVEEFVEVEVVDVVGAVHKTNGVHYFCCYGLGQGTLAGAWGTVEEVASLVRNAHFSVPLLAVNELLDIRNDIVDKLLGKYHALQSPWLFLLGNVPIALVVFVNGDAPFSFLGVR